MHRYSQSANGAQGYMYQWARSLGPYWTAYFDPDYGLHRPHVGEVSLPKAVVNDFGELVGVPL